MNRQERARIIASLTDDELRQLREHAADPDAPDDADRRFAKNFFSGRPDDKSGADDEQHQGASEYSEEQRRWARELFADDEDNPILASLTNGKTVGRWQRPAVDG